MACIFEKGEMSSGSNAIENHSGYLYVRTKIFETEYGCSYRIGSGGCIDKENNRYIKQAGNIGTAARHFVITVKHAHHSLDHTDIGPGSIASKQLPYMSLRGKKSVKVDAIGP